MPLPRKAAKTPRVMMCRRTLPSFCSKRQAIAPTSSPSQNAGQQHRILLARVSAAREQALLLMKRRTSLRVFKQDALLIELVLERSWCAQVSRQNKQNVLCNTVQSAHLVVDWEDHGVEQLELAEVLFLDGRVCEGQAGVLSTHLRCTPAACFF